MADADTCVMCLGNVSGCSKCRLLYSLLLHDVLEQLAQIIAVSLSQLMEYYTVNVINDSHVTETI